MAVTSTVVEFPKTPIPVMEDYSFAQDAHMRALIKKQFATDLTDDEFLIFLDVCRVKRLDPRQGHIHAWVFSKTSETKRRVTHYTAITGLRSIAERTGTYMPSDRRVEYVRCEKTRANPAGIESATVTVKKLGKDGVYHHVVGEAFWEEYAPIQTPGTQFEGDVPEEPFLDGSSHWAKMPRLMLAKVAEAVALRRGWPEELSFLYSDDELARSRLEDNGQRFAQSTLSVAIDPGHDDFPSRDVREDIMDLDPVDQTVREIVREPVVETLTTPEPEDDPQDDGEPTYFINLLNGRPEMKVSLAGYIRYADAVIDKYAETDPKRVLEFSDANRTFGCIWDDARAEKLRLSKLVEACRKRLSEEAGGFEPPPTRQAKRTTKLSDRARPRRAIPMS